MAQYDFTVFGTATTVKVFKFKEFPRVGVTTSLINENFDTLFFGGMGYNVAAALAKLGARVLPALVYSDRRFDAEIKEINKYGKLDSKGFFFSLTDEYEYSLCYMFEDENGDNMTFGGVYSGKNEVYEHTAIPRRRHVIEDWMVDDSEWVIVTCPATTLELDEILDVLVRKNKKFVFSLRNDPRVFNHDNICKGISNAKVIIGNEGEIEFLEKEFGLTSIVELFDAGKADVIIKTVGGEGSLIFERCANGYRKHLVPVTACNKVDIVGAGDAFEAGFMYGYVKGMDVVTCAQYGSTLSAFVIEEDGSTTNLPARDELLARVALREDVKFTRGAQS